MNQRLGEGRVDPGDRTSSVETAKLVIDTFAAIKDNLQDKGVRARSVDGKLRYQVGYPAFWNVAEDSPEYNELISKAFTSSIDLRYSDDIVGFAEVIRRLPSETENQRSDWHARFMFPKDHQDAKGQPNGRRVVLDFWLINYAALLDATRQLSREEQGAVVTDFFKKQSSGIPAGAENVQHFVLGRDEEISSGQRQMVEDILGYFQEACRPVEMRV